MAFERLKMVFSVWKYHRAAKCEGLDAVAAKQVAMERALDEKLARDGISGAEAERRKAFVTETMAIGERQAARGGDSGPEFDAEMDTAVSALIKGELGDMEEDGWDGALELPDDVEAYLTDPEFDRTYVQDDDALAPHEVVVDLVRKVRLDWETAEIGAPMVAAQRPFGEDGVLEQLNAHFKSAFGDASPMDAAKRLVEITNALNTMLVHAKLSPGAYSLKNVSMDEFVATMAGYGDDDDPVGPAYLGFDDDGRFVLTNEHITLLRSLDFDWIDEFDVEERLEMGRWPTPSCDPKRPYGDMSYFQLDMAVALDEVPADHGADWEPSEEADARYIRLHHQMLPAMQVFLENAKLPE